MNSTLDFPPLDVDQMASPIVASEAVDIAEIRAGKAVVHLNRTAQAIAELTGKYKGAIFDMATTGGDKKARAARLELVSTRTAIEARRKELKAPALEFGKLIDSEAARLTKLVVDLEDPIDAQIKADERRRQEERDEAERREQSRVAKHTAGIDTIRSYLTRCHGLPSIRIAAGISALRNMDGAFTSETWEEFAVVAASAQCETLEAMGALLAKTLAAEEHAAETERLRALVEEQARELAELRAQAARVAAIEAERQASLMRVEEARAMASPPPVVVVMDSIPVKEATKEDLVIYNAIAAGHSTISSQVAAEAAAESEEGPPVKEPAYMIGDLCHKIGAGFSMTAEFVAGLGFKPSQTEGRSKLYTQTQCAGIKAALIARIEAKL